MKFCLMYWLESDIGIDVNDYNYYNDDELSEVVAKQFIKSLSGFSEAFLRKNKPSAFLERNWGLFIAFSRSIKCTLKKEPTTRQAFNWLATSQCRNESNNNKYILQTLSEFDLALYIFSLWLPEKMIFWKTFNLALTSLESNTLEAQLIF